MFPAKRTTCREFPPVRGGMAALEIVMIIGAMLPIAILLLVAIREALKFIHSIIGNLVGSPLF